MWSLILLGLKLSLVFLTDITNVLLEMRPERSGGRIGTESGLPVCKYQTQIRF